jgi:hypothetical protein
MATIGFIDALMQGRLPVLEWAKDAFTGEAAGVYHSGLYLTGTPGAGSVSANGVNGAIVSNGRSGTVAAPAAAAGKSCWLNWADWAPLAATPNVDFGFWVDRLWDNSGLSVTTAPGAQAIVPATLPPRDANMSTAGVGVGLAVEISTATGNGAPVVATIVYTNSSGVAGRSTTVTIPATAVAGTWLPISLAAGDYGVQGPTSFALASTLTSGALSLVMYRVLGRKLRALPGGGIDSFAMADGGHAIPDGTAPHMVYHLTGTAVVATHGTIEFAQA